MLIPKTSTNYKKHQVPENAGSGIKSNTQDGVEIITIDRFFIEGPNSQGKNAALTGLTIKAIYSKLMISGQCSRWK